MKRFFLILKNTRGFTLFETVIVLSLFILILFALVGLYIQFSKLFSLNAARFNTVNGTRSALTAIGGDVTQATRVLAEHTFGGAQHVTATNTLVLKLPAMTAGGDMIADTWDYVAYYLTSSSLYRVVDGAAGSARADATKFIGAAVKSAAFSFDSATTTEATAVGVSVETESAVARATARNSDSATFTLRNY